MKAKRVEERPRPGEMHKRKVWPDLKKDVNTYSPSVRVVSSRTTHLVQMPFSEHLHSANLAGSYDTCLSLFPDGE